ncbi:hypothetical protein F5Y04DRAFT_290472 [Hypomontagnella monticulosa]|nr:hypothetical protein F5Y04DRAFT_290472 [Hypomontagnella monticulosa]
MDQLAPCAINCLAEALENSTCLPTDIVCQCTDANFNAQGSSCITTSCSVREALSAKNITSSMCGVEPAVDHSFLPPIATFLAIAGTAVALRLVARFVSGTKFWWDDLCNFGSFLVGSAYLGLFVKAIQVGFGTDIWAVPPDDITVFFRLVLCSFQVYGICRFLVRCSIILFYIRIFNFTSASKILWVTFAANLIIWIVWFFLSIFQCKPVSYFWDQWDGEHEGSCFPANFVAWSAGAVDLAEDLVLLALPFPYIRKLRLGLKKKIATSIMFAVGLLTVICSIVRFPTTYQFTYSLNSTLDIVPIGIWSCMELYVGIICACLPSIYPLLKPLLNCVTPSSRKHSAASSEPHPDPNVPRSFLRRDKKKYKPDWDVTLTNVSVHHEEESAKAPYTRIDDTTTFTSGTGSTNRDYPTAQHLNEYRYNRRTL